MVLPYLKSMLPYCCAALPAAVRGAFLLCAACGGADCAPNALHEAGVLLLALFAVGLCQAALLPQIEFGPDGILLDMGDPAQNRINLIPLRIFYDTYIEVTKFHNYSYLVVSFWEMWAYLFPSACCRLCCGNGRLAGANARGLAF